MCAYENIFYLAAQLFLILAIHEISGDESGSGIQHDLNAYASNEIEVPLLVNNISTIKNDNILPKDMDPILYLNVSEYPGELCNRICVEKKHRICYFQFTLEFYQAMGVACGGCGRGIISDCNRPQCILGDGVEKGVMSINRQIPGPAIQVCKDDTVIVDVTNLAHGTAASIHWHGLHMIETPYMDGVPFVTQCPIPFANTFRYKFKATESGTHFYHSHSGHHKINGQYGALIVRQPTGQVQNSNNYDYDFPQHHIFISDWMHTYGEQFFPGLPSSSGIFPDSVLINGRGLYTNAKTGNHTFVHPTRYSITSGKRYRFRFINAISHACPFQLQVEKHDMVVIASDSYDIEPYSIDTLISNAGERYDFILHANHTKGVFLIRVRGLGVCGINQIESFAVLQYTNDDTDTNIHVPSFPNYDDSFPTEVVLNNPNVTCIDRKNDHCITELRSIDQDISLRNAIPDEKFFLAFNNYVVPNQEIFKSRHYNHFANLGSNITIVGAINNLSMVSLHSPPLTQPYDIDDAQFCDEFQWPEKCIGKKLCACVHKLDVRLGSIVELIIVDESESVGRMHHPFHLHGYRFMVTGLGQHPQGIPMNVSLAKEMEQRHVLSKYFSNSQPPFKDTVSIPSRGFAVVRFKAENPGFWLLHCHYEWHLAVGMGLILQVGTTSQMVKVPSSFPKCGNYLPKVRRPLL